MATLTKAILNRKLHPVLLEMGYLEFFNPGWTLYGKYLGNGWYLQLNLTIHRYYDDQFTADVYLSKHTWINDCRGDTPHGCFTRLEDYTSPARTDWWEGLVDESVADFIATLKEAEPRIIASISTLEAGMQTSICVTNIIKTTKCVVEEYNEQYGTPTPAYHDLNLRKPLRTPEEWIEASKKYFDRGEPQLLYCGDYLMHAKLAFKEWVMREHASMKH